MNVEEQQAMTTPNSRSLSRSLIFPTKVRTNYPKNNLAKFGYILDMKQQGQQQHLVPPSFPDEFLNPLAVPSPTAEWLNFMSMTNNDPLQGPAYSSAVAAAAAASAFATTSSTARLPNSAGSTLPNTPNSSVSSGSFSDGPEPPATAAGPSASTSKRKTPDRAIDEENEEIQSPELKKPTNKTRKKGPKRVREPRYAIQTRSDIEIMEDGYKWRKYGQKAVKNSPNPRSYYRCTAPKCPVRKRVERSAEDPGLVITTYEGTHIHLSPAMNGSASRASNSDAPSLLVASGENRPGGAAYQPPASSFPFASSVNPVPPARSTYDLTVQIQSGLQRDHEAATSSSLSSYTQDIQTAGASTAYNLQSLNIQESDFLTIRSHGSWHGSLQEFNPSMPDENLINMLRTQQQQMHGTQNQMREALQNTEGQMFRAVNFGAHRIGGESSDDILTGLHIPFWASGSEPRSTTRGMEEQLPSASAAANTDESQLRDDQSPINDELLGDVVRLGVHW
ncbi:unnamed protein product [Sphagnum jensenii]|uniref:WRKY domain-containing protein n=1 Tax=Sphagnum jensenii TaxID=128206 RepID=A0ABP1AD21_9BRYO